VFCIVIPSFDIGLVLGDRMNVWL